jgi:hypothetical protein
VSEASLTFELGTTKLLHGRAMLYLVHRLRNLVDTTVEGRALQELLSQNVSVSGTRWRVRGVVDVLWRQPTPKIEQVSI